MSVKQIKWHAAVLAVTVFAVITALFALATVTSNAAEASYDPETRTYTLSDSTYDQQINLENGTTTTIVLSGYNKLTYGKSYSDPTIGGNGNLVITGEGTLEAVSNIRCKAFTMDSGTKLILGSGLSTFGDVTVNDAEIEPGSRDSYVYCGGNYSAPSKIVFNNARLKAGMSFDGPATLNDCTVTLENKSLSSSGGELTINGGTYTFNNDVTDQYSYSNLYSSYRAVIKNAVIKANSATTLMNLEMTDSTLEITVPKDPNNSYAPIAIYGDNLIFVGSKIKIDGYDTSGIVGNQQVIMIGNTELDIQSLSAGIVGKTVQITHSSGKVQVTDPDNAMAAIIASDSGNGSYSTPGTLTLKSVYVKEPAGGTVGETVIRTSTSTQSYEIPVQTIMDGNVPAKTVVLEAEHKTHTWDAGKVTTEPTETAEGVKTYTCTVCGATKTEAIPKLTPQGSQDSQGSQGSQADSKGEDGTPFGKGASVEAAEAAILALPNDNDPAGTAFGLLQLKASKVTKNSINLKWKAVPGAAKYILFANKCGTGNKYKKLGEVTGTSYTATQAAGAAIQKGTYYKFMMIAADSSGKVISTSKTVHAATKGGKIGNHKKVTVKKSVTKKAKKLKKGKTLKLKAKAVPQAKKLKVRKHRGVMYETSNPAVAQVNGKGTVKGVGKGTCYIYAYAQNGTCAKVKVTVK